MSLLDTKNSRLLLALWALVSSLIVVCSYSIPFARFKTTRGLLSENPAACSPLFSRRAQRCNTLVEAGAHVMTTRLMSTTTAETTTTTTREEEAVATTTTVVPPPVQLQQHRQQQESAHLKLASPAMLPRTNGDKVDHETNDDESSDNNNNMQDSSTQQATAVLHTYHDPSRNITLSGLNVSKRRFTSWVNHTLEGNVSMSMFTKRRLHTDSMETRQELRSLWKQRCLLTDRTEVLAVYQSDDTTESKRKRGGFADLLHIYAERLFGIIQDEVQDWNQTSLENQTYHDGGLVGWLEREYGTEETRKLQFETIRDMPVEEQHEVFQHFLEWFRSRFPYYYDRCDACGASAKDDTALQEEESTVVNNNGNVEVDSDDDDEDDDDSGSFLGYVYPSPEELVGKASRTELYQCHKCGSFTRFPRYNAASSVIQHKRGRCGEYSMLLYRILRATGHTCRWIVDWADHVWAEVFLGDKWIHLDPCEAAVNQPLLYEEWGKQQTYIVAFHAPLMSADIISIHKNAKKAVPLIEDVTLRYTSADLETIRKRRDESDEELQTFMERTIVDLEQKLTELLR